MRWLESGLYKTSYCRSTEDKDRPAAQFPGNNLSAPGALETPNAQTTCQLTAGPVSYIPRPTDVLFGSKAGQMVSTYSELNLVCFGAGACELNFKYPPDYFGIQTFEYRLRSVGFKDDKYLWRGEEDFSPWRSVSVTVDPVPDDPVVLFTSLAHEDSENKTIMEDTTFKVRFGKAYNDKRVENKGVGNRIYYSYFDVDETDDLAEKITITSVQSKEGVGPVLLNPQTGLPLAVPNETAFVCNAEGICEATFLAAENFFTADNQEAFFEIKVLTKPRDQANQTSDRRRESAASGKVTFTVSPVDDGPRPGGSGGDGVSIPEDEVTIVNIEKDAQQGLGYVDVDPNDFAERVEIGFIELHDTDGNMSPVINDKGEQTSEFYPDGSVTGAPRAVPVTRSSPETQFITIRGKKTGSNSTYGSNLQFVDFAEMNSFKIPATPNDPNLPERYQFTCQKNVEGGKAAGTCEFMVTPPLHFNTSKFGQAGSGNEIKSHRSARFKFRIFSRDRNLWSANNLNNGQWTPWQAVELYFSPKNDQPVWNILSNSAMSSHRNESLCGTTMVADPLCAFPPPQNQAENNSVAKPVKIFEDNLGELAFFWNELYSDPADYNTETYTYKKNFDNTPAGQWQPQNFSFGHTFLGQKISFEMKAMQTHFAKYLAGLGDPDPEYGWETRWSKEDLKWEDIIDGDTKSRLLSHTGGGVWETMTGAVKNHFGIPAAVAEHKSNVNCGVNGKCWLKLIPAADFFGTLSLKTRLADGSSAPSLGDWTDGDRSPTLSLEVSNLNDNPVTQDFVLDLFEDEPLVFRFGRLPNRGVCGGSFGSTKKDPDCMELFGPCPRVWTTPRDNPNDLLRNALNLYPNGCMAPNNEQDLNVYRLYTYEDVDREDVRAHEVTNISSANLNVTPSATNADVSGFESLHFNLSTAKNFNNATYQVQASNADTSQPFLYGATPTAKGDLTFDWRVRTSTTCLENDGCFSKDKSGANSSKVFARILPVDDPPIVTMADTTVRNMAFRTVNEGKLEATGGAGKEANKVFATFNATENKPFMVTINESQYVDGDGHSAPFNRVVGIRQCQAYMPPIVGLFPPPPVPIADNYMFKWGKPIEYNEILKDAFSVGRIDPFSNLNSLLRGGSGTMSSGTLNQTVANARGELYKNEDPTKNGVNLSSGCSLSGGLPTGTCSIELQPPRNVNGEFLLCLEVRSFAKLGDFIRSSQDRWARAYFKVVIENVDNPPRISQLPIRARANEDHDIDIQVGPWPFSWLYWEVPRPDDSSLAIRPGYWDYDQNNGTVNPAESVIINMRGDGIVFGSKGGTIRYDSTPDNGTLTYDGTCSASDDGNDANDICTIPCKADGFCNFQFNPPEHFNGRVKLKYWVKSKPSDAKNLSLSSKKSENLRSARGNNQDYALYEQDDEYLNIPEMMQCADTSLLDIDNWRFNTEQTMVGSYNQTLHPVLVPSYPQLNPPNSSRVLPQLFGRDAQRIFNITPLDPAAPAVAVTEAKTAQQCSLDDSGEFKCTYPFPSKACGSLEEGSILIDVHPVPDKPFPTLPVRQFVTGQPVEQNEIILGIKATSGEDGYQDGDGDGTRKILWRYRATDPDPVIAFGSITTDPSPPATPTGLSSLEIDASSGYRMIGAAVNSAAPGCDLASKKCRFYFHPKAGLTTTTLNLNYGVETGVDNWRSDETSVGVLKIEVFNEAPTITADLNGGPFDINEDSIGAVLRKADNTPIAFVIDEGGSSREDFQQINVTFTSSNELIIPSSGITFSVSDGAGVNFGALTGNVLITPAPNRFSNTPVTITMRAAEAGAGGLFYETSFNVRVNSVLDSPVVTSTNPVASYTTNEDTTLSIANVTIDEGGGIDEDNEVVSVSFASSDTTVIPNANITFSKTDNASDFGATPGTITVVPAQNRNSVSPVTITMTVSDGTAAPNLVRTFTVVVTPVDDPPFVMLGSPPASSYQAGLNTMLEIYNVQVDEGGIATGNGNEDAQALSFSFSSSNTAVIPLANISIDGNDAASDSSILKRVIRVTPVAKSASPVTITMTISDGNLTGTRSFGVTVADPPNGSISCTPAGGNLAFGEGQAVSLTCSGATPPAAQTVSYTLKDNCSNSVTINASTGVVSGTMPAADCQVWVSATSGGVEIDPAGQRKLTLLSAKVLNVGAGSPTIDSACRVTLQATATYQNCAFSSATLTPGAGFSSPQTTSSTFSALLTNFSQTTATWSLGVSSNEGTTSTGSATFSIAGEVLNSLGVRVPLATVVGQTGEGIQAGWVFPSACVDNSCLTSQPASIAAGTQTSCTINEARQLLCWGDNSNGQLGFGATPGLSYSAAQNVTTLVAPSVNLSNAAQVSSGFRHTCVLRSDGELFCAGENDRGQLGDGTTDQRQTYTNVRSGVAAVTTGRKHTCALLTTGDVYCAGDNTVGQLGNGSDVSSVTSSSTFVQVSLGAPAVAIAAGSGHTCALLGAPGSRSIKCWGDNFKDQLGNAALIPDYSSTPVLVDQLDISKRNIAAGIFAGGGFATPANTYYGHTCILTTNGEGHCWGDNSSSQLGDNPATPGQAVRIAGLTNLVSIAPGEAHTCALNAAGQMYCFGKNDSGQLGIGTTSATPTFAPSLVTFAGVFTAVAAGAQHTCATTNKGTVHCFGRSNEGQIGDAQKGAARNSPTLISGSHVVGSQDCKRYSVAP